ncbi:MAG: hypothetical protein ACUVRN_07370 [Candidatus Caldatribacteriaceae bacterium]
MDRVFKIIFNNEQIQVFAREPLAEEIKLYLAEHLTKWSILMEVVFVDRLPLTLRGKLDYRKLEEESGSLS